LNSSLIKSPIDSFGPSVQPIQISDSVHYETSSPSPSPSVELNVFADAGYGAAHLSSNARFTRDVGGSDPDRFWGYHAEGLIDITIDDVFITGPGSTVPTKLNMHLDGSLDAGTTLTTSPGGISASSDISVQLLASGSSVGYGSYSMTSQDGNFPTPGPYGMLGDFDGDDVLSSDTFNAPVNVAFPVRIIMSARSIAQMDDTKTGQASAFENFGNTLSFATDRPVFDLPAGYTASSVSAGDREQPVRPRARTHVRGAGDRLVRRPYPLATRPSPQPAVRRDDLKPSAGSTSSGANIPVRPALPREDRAENQRCAAQRPEAGPKQP
jgi:hypothetical protein